MIGIGDLSILSPCKDPQLMAHLKGQEEGEYTNEKFLAFQITMANSLSWKLSLSKQPRDTPAKFFTWTLKSNLFKRKFHLPTINFQGDMLVFKGYFSGVNSL